MTTISPSILSCDFLKLKDEIVKFDSAENIWIHLDIMDGHYVPNLTFGPVVIKNIHKITGHKLDAHLMVNNPEDHAEWLTGSGIHNLTFHWEATKHHDRLIQFIKENYPSVGISLNPSTPVDHLSDEILAKLDLVLVMSVNPGFGNQSFIDYSLEKISKLDEKRKKLGHKFLIQVDGGVSDNNAKELISAGADNLVAGSYIFSSDNYLNQIDSLR